MVRARRRTLWLLLVAVLTALTACTDADEPATRTVELDDRPFRLHVPATFEKDNPLVVALHGFTSNAAELESYFQLLPESDRRGFLYALPSGTENADGDRFWNAHPACCDFRGLGVDDVAYLHRLITTVQDEYDVGEVYLVGHSNGGFMAYRMACEHPELITAIVSLAGAATGCTTTTPVSVLQIHGTGDRVIAYDGGANAGRPYPSAEDSIAIWRRNDDCSDGAGRQEPVDLDAGIPGPETTVTTYGCAADTTVALWSIDRGSHVPGLTDDFPKAVTDWLVGTT